MYMYVGVFLVLADETPSLFVWCGCGTYCHPYQVLSIPDNDQLSAQVARAIGADLLILLSDVEGIYSGPPGDHASRLIRTYYPEDPASVKFWGKSRVGRGGMESKVGMGGGVAWNEFLCMVFVGH